MKYEFTIDFKSVSVHSGEVNHDSSYKEQTFVGLIERMCYYYYLKMEEYVHGRHMGNVHFVNVFYKDYEVSGFLTRVIVEEYQQKINEIWEYNKLNYNKYIESIEKLEKEFFEELEEYYEIGC